jgi:hypothetical protein
VKGSKGSEKELYSLVVEAVKHYLEQKGIDAAFWITSERIPEEVSRYLRDEVLFLVGSREFRPDIMGVIKSSLVGLGIVLVEKLVTVEVKDGEIDLQDWFQARNYGDLYDAPISLLISPKSMPERLKRLIEHSPGLRYRPMSGYRIYYARLDTKEAALTEFFPEEIIL